MSNLAAALHIEFLKAWRSRLPLYTVLGITILPLIGGLMMVILRDPELAREMGLISVKAQITAGTADWPGYLNFLALGSTIGGIMLFGLVGAWVFGREYSDHTIKDLLALPTPRAAIVAAKYTIVGIWSLVLIVWILGIGLVVGMAIGLPPPVPGLVRQAIGDLAFSAILTILIVTPIIFSASVGRGYLLPVGVIFLCIILGQVSSIMGWGEFFPWAIPAVFAQAAGKHSGYPGASSYIIVLLTGAAGIAGTFLWWELVDETQ